MLAMSERLQVTVYSPHPARQGPTGSCTTPHAAEYRGHQGREFPHGHRLPMPRKSRRTRNGSGATGGECSMMAASHSPRPSPPAVDEQSRNNVSTTCPSNAPNPAIIPRTFSSLRGRCQLRIWVTSKRSELTATNSNTSQGSSTMTHLPSTASQRTSGGTYRCPQRCRVRRSHEGGLLVGRARCV